QSVIARALSAFLSRADIDLVQVVIARGDEGLFRTATRHLADHRLLPPVAGGTTRQASVAMGLRALVRHGARRVLIHDAARPFVAAEIIARVLAALDAAPGAIAAIPLADTLHWAGAGNCIDKTLPRGDLWRAQTPQGFRFADILAAHAAADAAGRDDFTDD